MATGKPARLVNGRAAVHHPDAMTAATPRPVVRLKAGRQKRARGGHPWVYSNEIDMDEAANQIPPGGLVRLETASGAPVGAATFNPKTLIAARLIDRDPKAAVDAGFIAGKLEAALRLREKIYPGGCYRLIHAEADGLPGLIVDRYGDRVVVQANTAGMDRLLPEVLGAIDTVVAPDAVVLRNDSGVRRLEGLAEEIRVAKGTLDGPTTLTENGVAYVADLTAGQKTGWFYDQRENRAMVARFAQGARVLDLYAYAGGFAVLCAKAGAREVAVVDRSAPALALAEESARINGVEAACRFRRAEAFPELERLAKAGERFDMVVADPPAFVKSKKDLAQGARGYRKLARLAAALVGRGGFLFIASCSHNVDRATFDEQIARGLEDANRAGRILAASGASPDHPVHPALPETAYLKAALVQLD